MNITQASKHLDVSTATVRNWIKTGLLNSQKVGRSLVISDAEISELKDKIKSGEVSRLSKRANKNSSKESYIPEERISKKSSIPQIEKIINFVSSNNLETNSACYYLALNYLHKNKLIDFQDTPPFFTTKKNNLNSVLREWKDGISKDSKYLGLLKMDISNEIDILGVLYQSIINVGKKSNLGSYYTPVEIVSDIRESYKDKIDENSEQVLDPCCGTGQFLLEFGKAVSTPASLWGYDIDDIAVKIAKVNLIVEFPDLDFMPNVYVKDSIASGYGGLFEQEEQKFDLVATNPPWGFHFSENQMSALSKSYPMIRSGESFSFFLQSALKKAKQGGIVSFILPESILNVKIHADIRKELLSNYSIKKIKNLGRPFKKVFTGVYRIDIENTAPNQSSKIKIISSSDEYFINQNRFLENSDYVISVGVNPEDQEIIDKVYSFEHTTLKNQADWALGIVTGNNKKYVLDQKVEGAEKVYKGKNLDKFVLDSNSSWIVPNFELFQQVAPVQKYRANEKLIYKFISKKLVFVYDSEKVLTLNSANILIPKIKNYSIKVICALFNSSLYQFLFQKKFNSIKVLRGHLESLPIPIIKESQVNHISELVDKYILERKKTILSVLDQEIYKLFDISAEQQEHIQTEIER